MPIYKPENCTFYVYAWLRAKDSRNGQAGSPYYVGKGKGARAKQKHVSRNWVAPLEDQIQILSANMNEVDAFQLEMFLIYLYGRIDLGTGCLHNRTAGGEGSSNIIMSAETKKKMSVSQTGMKRGPFTKEHIDKMKLAAVGRKHTQETKDKIAETNRNQPLELKQRRANSNRGNKHKVPRSDSTRKKMSESAKNSEANKRNLASARMINVGSRWMTHSESKDCCKVPACQLEEFANSGYQFGRLMSDEHREKFVLKKLVKTAKS